MVTSEEDKEAAVWNYFTKLIGSTDSRRNTLNLETFYQPPHELDMLDAPISESEVWETIKNMPLDKSPGPDGFTGRFYRSCWNIIKHDIMAAIGAIHGGDSRQLHLLNAAFMVLIPKKEEAVRVSDYRPISLVHSFAKLLTKILANRLAPKLSKLIAPN